MKKRFVLKSVLRGYVVLVDFSDDADRSEDDNYEVEFDNMHDAIAFMQR